MNVTSLLLPQAVGQTSVEVGLVCPVPDLSSGSCAQPTLQIAVAPDTSWYAPRKWCVVASMRNATFGPWAAVCTRCSAIGLCA